MVEVKELNDEELEKANGGTMIETRDDFKEFRKLKLISSEDSFSPLMVRQIFKDYNIILQDHGGLKNNNQYFFENREITHEEALQIIRDTVGKK